MVKRSQGMAVLLMMLVMVSLFLSACKHQGDKRKEILVGAAASLKHVMEQIKENYEKREEEITLEFTYGSSGTLEQQIRQGAPIDVFLSASLKQIQSLEKDHYLIEETVTDLMENRIVLIVPSDSGISLSSFEEVTGLSKIAIGDPDSVPAGKYACEVFDYYGVLEEAKNIAAYGKDVTEVLTWVSSGNVEAGVVYATDAASTDQVTVALVAPEESHSKVIYPAGVVEGSKQEEAAKDFLQYLTSEEAQRVFEEYGFIPIG